MRCLLSGRFSMQADLLHWTGITTGGSDDVSQGSFGGTYQDPISGEILNDWEPAVDDVNTPTVDESTFSTFDCIARGIVDGGIRVAGTTERFGDIYTNIDFVKLWTPANVLITKRDRITNIRIRNGAVIWNDEESDGLPTVFNVNGVTPLFDAWNRHVENFVLLERAPGDR
jgi:hypothetical protein